MKSDADVAADLSPQEMHDEILRMVGRYAAKVHGSRAFKPGESAVPVSGRVYGATEMKLLVESALEFWLTTGRFNDMFEERLKLFIGVRSLLTCNSGSSANLLAVTSLTSHLLCDRRLLPGDEVITCATGFPTTAIPSFRTILSRSS